jgi:6,7-dimethyl-8-ribityllumazine synthase
MEKIHAGSRSVAFYNDEAKARLEAGDAPGALEILALAEKNGCSDDYTAAIRANALRQSGKGDQAAALRMENIHAGSRNAAFYADEAKARLAVGDAPGALEILALAEKSGCGNDYTAAIRASALRR